MAFGLGRGGERPLQGMKAWSPPSPVAAFSKQIGVDYLEIMALVFEAETIARVFCTQKTLFQWAELWD